MDVVDVDELLSVEELMGEISKAGVEDIEVLKSLDSEVLIDEVEPVILVPRLVSLISYLPVPGSDAVRTLFVAWTYLGEHGMMLNLELRMP